MPNPSPTPNPDAKPIFPVEPPPDGFSQFTFEKKMDWLDRHGLESDKTVNLGDCYRRCIKLTQIFSVVFKVVKRLSETVKDKGSASLRKYLGAFIKALNVGVGHLSNYIFGNVTGLINTGKVEDEEAASPPAVIPELPTISDEDDVTSTTTRKSFNTSFWGIFVDTLNILIDTWPWIHKVQAGLAVSYAQLLKNVVYSGQTFFTEYQKEQGGDQPQ